MGGVSFRRETIFRDWVIGSRSSRDLWIACSSSRVASSLSIRRLIVWDNLLARRMAWQDTLLGTQSRYAAGHTRNALFPRQRKYLFTRRRSPMHPVRVILWTVAMAYSGFLLTGQGLRTFNSLSITEAFLSFNRI